MEVQIVTIVMVMDITENLTLGGNNVAFGMEINVNQRVTNANTFFWSKLDFCHLRLVREGATQFLHMQTFIWVRLYSCTFAEIQSNLRWGFVMISWLWISAAYTKLLNSNQNNLRWVHFVLSKPDNAKGSTKYAINIISFIYSEFSI